MSWFTDIAGKAENLLNQVDKSAATALKNKSKSGSVADIRVKTDQRTFQSFTPLTTATSQTFQHHNSPSLDNSRNYKRLYSSPKRKSESDDEKLMLFLNSTEAISDSKVEAKADGQKVVEETFKPNTAASLPKDESKSVMDEGKLLEDSSVSISIPQTEAIEVLVSNDDDAASDQIILPNPVKNDDKADTYKELSNYKSRAEHAETEMKRMQRKLEHWNSQISGNDQLVRELQGRDSDLVAALDAKDSQLAVLKVRLEEADSETRTKRKAVQELQSENERNIRHQAESEAMYTQTIDSLRTALTETEMEMNKCKETFRASQNENLFRISKMEEEQRHMAENVTNLQRKWSEQNERNKDLSSQLLAANRSFDTLQQEYNDYKQKAQRILQSKEKLIASLKEGTWDGEKSFEGDNSFAMLTAEAEGMKQDRDTLREELRKATEQVETLRNEIQDMEKMAQVDSNAAREHFRNLEEQLHQERLFKDEVQLHNVQLKEEIEFMKENLSRTQSNLQSRIHDREVEIEKLRKQLTAKSLSTVSQDELESRLHALTENLIHKQTIVEALSTEKNSLVLQLERLEQQLKEAQMYGSQSHAVVGVSHIESERKQKQHIFLENPFDSHLTRKVKRAYGSVDALSIRMGVFFRRYPIARMFIIVYMLLLHFWVMIVLLTYEPEIHTSVKKM